VTTFQSFKDRVMGDLLPAFCDDPSRGWGREGFKEDWGNVTEKDAADFLVAFDAGLIEHQGRGRYRAPKSFAGEQFFWSGTKTTSPRRFTLWIEPIITVAVLSRVHFKWGWPKELIGTQSKKYEFDATAYRASDMDNEYVACEVKKTVSELDQLVELMQRYSTDDHITFDRLKSGKEKNAFKKLNGLKARRAPIFWAVGPNETNRIFRMLYTEVGAVIFNPATEEALAYPDV
jgi:hypothetical protein